VANRPNILLVMADQHRADAMGCAGETGARTPNLDALASRGVRFSRVSCQGPLCMPARASFLTERYVRDHGVYTNWAEVPADWPTYLHALQGAGYHTCMLGKAHLTKEEGTSVAHVDELAHHLHARGFTEVIETGDKFVSGEEANRYTDYLASRGLIDVYRKHIADRSYHGENESGQGATKRVPMWDATPMPVPLADYIDTWHGDATVRWIEEYDRDEPFFLFVGFPGPHDPWDAPSEAVARMRDAEIAAPRSTQRPATAGAGNYGKLVAGMLNLSDTDTMTDEAITGMRRAYLANVNVIDDAVGRILDAVARTGRADDTWVVYTADHGEMAGDHGLMSKCVLYEGAVRVPLIVTPPSGAGGLVVDDLIEHLDVPATVRAIAGAGDVAQSEGRSLLPYLDGGAVSSRDVSISEDWGFASFETERYKVVVDEDRCEPCQLFDLEADPAEDENLVASTAHAPVLDDLMETHVRPFLKVTPTRPHPSPFA
jgi:choline-sulfatase